MHHRHAFGSLFHQEKTPSSIKKKIRKIDFCFTFLPSWISNIHFVTSNSSRETENLRVVSFYQHDVRTVRVRVPVPYVPGTVTTVVPGHRTTNSPPRCTTYAREKVLICQYVPQFLVSRLPIITYARQNMTFCHVFVFRSLRTVDFVRQKYVPRAHTYSRAKPPAYMTHSLIHQEKGFLL
jgi:hypothetical protein